MTLVQPGYLGPTRWATAILAAYFSGSSMQRLEVHTASHHPQYIKFLHNQRLEAGSRKVGPSHHVGSNVSSYSEFTLLYLGRQPAKYYAIRRMNTMGEFHTSGSWMKMYAAYQFRRAG